MPGVHGDRRATARGLVEVAHDRFSVAEGHLAYARQLAEEQVDVASSGAHVELLAGVIELTCARQAHAAGQEVAARAHRRRAHRRFARVSEQRKSKGAPAGRHIGPALERAGTEDALAAPLASGRAPSTRAPEPAADLELSPDGMWFRAHGGERVSMRRRHAMRRLLLCLVSQRSTAPGQSVPMSTLIEVGWPSERILAGAAMNRLYNTIAVLRSLGLGEMLLTAEDGYVLEPSLSVSVHPW